MFNNFFKKIKSLWGLVVGTVIKSRSYTMIHIVPHGEIGGANPQTRT